MPDESHGFKIGRLKGEVKGYQDKDYTRNIALANVFVKIVVDKKEYSTYDKKGQLRLREAHPDKYAILFEMKLFEPHPVNERGEFELKVPVGSWEYIVCAHVEEKDYNHTDKLGSSGTGMKGSIKGPDFTAEKDFTIDGIIVPVNDRWFDAAEGTRKGDPKTEPGKVPSGIVDKDLFDRIEEHRRQTPDEDLT